MLLARQCSGGVLREERGSYTRWERMRELWGRALERKKKKRGDLCRVFDGSKQLLRLTNSCRASRECIRSCAASQVQRLTCLHSQKPLRLATLQREVTVCGQNLHIVGKLRKKQKAKSKKKKTAANWLVLNDTAERSAVTIRFVCVLIWWLLRVLLSAFFFFFQKWGTENVGNCSASRAKPAWKTWKKKTRENSIPVPPCYRDSPSYSRLEAKSSPDPCRRRGRSGQEKKRCEIKGECIILFK